MRLGLGGTYTTRAIEAAHVQSVFLFALGTHAPHVVQALAGEPFEVYKLLHATLPDKPIEFGASKRLGFIGGWENFNYADEYTSPYRRNVRDALLLWASIQRLEAEWVLDGALRTLHRWSFSGYDGNITGDGEMVEVPHEPNFRLWVHRADLMSKTLEEEMKCFDDTYKRARDAHFATAKTYYEPRVLGDRG